MHTFYAVKPTKDSSPTVHQISSDCETSGLTKANSHIMLLLYETLKMQEFTHRSHEDLCSASLYWYVRQLHSRSAATELAYIESERNFRAPGILEETKARKRGGKSGLPSTSASVKLLGLLAKRNSPLEGHSNLLCQLTRIHS